MIVEFEGLCHFEESEASQDGAPYIYATFSDANDYKAGGEKRKRKILLVKT